MSKIEYVTLLPQHEPIIKSIQLAINEYPLDWPEYIRDSMEAAIERRLEDGDRKFSVWLLVDRKLMWKLDPK